MMNFTVEFLLLNVAGKPLQAQIHQIYKRVRDDHSSVCFLVVRLQQPFNAPQ